MKKSELIKISYDDLKKVVTGKGYKFFEGELNVNIIGVRMTAKFSNKWDDVLFLAYEENGKKVLEVYKDFTTVAGKYYVTEKLLNKEGVAILPEGQHKGLFKIGKHRNKYEALIQKRPVTVLRDKDKDELIDPQSHMSGMFGINMHHGYNSTNIDKNSAGCQVFKYVKEQKDGFMSDIKRSAERYGNSFTYTLLNKNDFKKP